ncbi:hypothetical protein U9M48_027116 [Paspalum notatum var. saurae]|uniref:Secreted protein n=1 Tax=Paspalum notatum var. saurae TaxID=547442 RepID=A0AAQ3WZQ0_PASNO
MTPASSLRAVLLFSSCYLPMGAAAAISLLLPPPPMASSLQCPSLLLLYMPGAPPPPAPPPWAAAAAELLADPVSLGRCSPGSKSLRWSCPSSPA